MKIKMKPVRPGRYESYGLMLTSETEHSVRGRIHNPHFPHEFQIWENRNGIDPNGVATSEPYSFLLSPLPITIVKGTGKPFMEGPTVSVGDEIEFEVPEGFEFEGKYLIQTKPLHDPFLTKVS